MPRLAFGRLRDDESNLPDPPNAPEIDAMAPLLKWFWIGLLPQLTVWIATTVCGGAVLGALGVVLGHRR